ncbi:MAG TPA: MarR family transcriptional regulator [Candidatus Monoglobus merdigallinarum]|uniref:MarR family transcriptional regulator n=1 Tax=Candidatus Monoglobus merdigallinarum TaxID=2838698 RepID=A0A9D1PPQ6_9FIRM|nr:MarR family transcriptional regulator [Candidatus Monoglobus merdigallinarum]
MDYLSLAEEYLKHELTLRRREYGRGLNRLAQGEMLVLAYISLCGGEACPGEISSKTGLSSARTAAMLGGMEHKGWVCRERSPSDGRRIEVTITEPGRRICERLREELTEKTVQMLFSLGEDDALSYVRITKKLAENRINNNAQNERG